MTKRRLPVLKAEPAPDSGEPPRPPWHWVGFGAVAVFVAWLPLASLAEWLKARVVVRFVGEVSDPGATAGAVAGLTPGDRARLTAIVIAFPAIALLVGAVAGGYLVGRYGDGVSLRHGALAGASAGLLAAALVWTSSGPSAAPLAVVVLAAAGTALGTRLGLRRRSPP